MKYMLSEIARICGGELIGEDLPVARVLTDSRNRPEVASSAPQEMPSHPGEPSRQ